MEKNIIVAISDNYAIGRDNSLLWHISEDLRYFKKVTSGGSVIMGRKTFQSIGRPLPGRVNIVVTRGEGALLPEGIEKAGSIEEAFSIAETKDRPCFVIGGGEIYRQAMQSADRLYVTCVHTVIDDADTFFPEIKDSEWNLESSSGVMKDEESGYGFEFKVFTRIK